MLLISDVVMAKILRPRPKASTLKAKDWTFEAKAIGPEAKGKAIEFGLKPKTWHRGLGPKTSRPGIED